MLKCRFITQDGANTDTCSDKNRVYFRVSQTWTPKLLKYLPFSALIPGINVFSGSLTSQQKYQ